MTDRHRGSLRRPARRVSSSASARRSSRCARSGCATSAGSRSRCTSATGSTPGSWSSAAPSSSRSRRASRRSTPCSTGRRARPPRRRRSRLHLRCTDPPRRTLLRDVWTRPCGGDVEARPTGVGRGRMTTCPRCGEPARLRSGVLPRVRRATHRPAPGGHERRLGVVAPRARSPRSSRSIGAARGGRR